MSMADIISQHAAYSTTWYEWDKDEDGQRVWYVVCDGCDWQRELQDTPSTDSARHVEQELIKAGYGLRMVKLDLDGKVL